MEHSLPKSWSGCFLNNSVPTNEQTAFTTLISRKISSNPNNNFHYATDEDIKVLNIVMHLDGTMYLILLIIDEQGVYMWYSFPSLSVHIPE